MGAYMSEKKYTKDHEWVSIENEIFCEIRNKMELVKKTSLPFVKKNYKKNGSNNE